VNRAAVTAGDLMTLAEAAVQAGAPLTAYELGRRVLDTAPPDGHEAMRARRLLSGLIPGYHHAMASDAARTAAWTRVLSRIITPGMRVLEIGTGGGLLALIAARAGGRLVTCERDAVMAAVARRVVADNGMTARITVLEAEAEALAVPRDLDAPADLLICDIFSDTVFGFDPMPAITHARAALLTPGAAVVPRVVSAWAALAAWHHPRAAAATPFDFTALDAFTPASIPVPHGAASPLLLSAGAELLRLTTTEGPGEHATGVVELAATAAGTCNGVALWVRMELDHDSVLESRPAGDRVAAFPSPRFIPFTRAFPVRPDDLVPVVARHDRNRLTISLAAGR
jgi:predicted O-methyltransferase YrrM